ncbi:unnamed protein product [Adineta steineri]|uniref:Uncharacterized protein n=1 Tax=Adineta steineri TaxID=433720 RepID=A0A820QY35_9BILA|nr:unnamed protein product [Adineta steineri]
MNWLVPDVPKTIQNKIDHERYIDQRERWTTHETTDEKFKQAAVASEAISKMRRPSNNLPSSTLETNDQSMVETKDEFPARQSKKKKTQRNKSITST